MALGLSARQPFHAVCVCVYVCVNPSGNDSEMTGPVGIVQRRHFQVPVSTFLHSLALVLSHSSRQTDRQTQLWGCILKIHRNSSWCLLPMHPPSI